MMSLEAIRQLNEEIAEQAEHEGKTPLAFDSEYQIKTKNFSLPNLGPHVPEGYERTEHPSVFVDKTGWGGDNEPAMSIDQFVRWLVEQFRKHPEYSYAMVEEGPMQAYVGQFQRVTD